MIFVTALYSMLAMVFLIALLFHECWLVSLGMTGNEWRNLPVKVCFGIYSARPYSKGFLSNWAEFFQGMFEVFMKCFYVSVKIIMKFITSKDSSGSSGPCISCGPVELFLLKFDKRYNVFSSIYYCSLNNVNWCQKAKLYVIDLGFQVVWKSRLAIIMGTIKLIYESAFEIWTQLLEKNKIYNIFLLNIVIRKK